jgi:hypothetical protein
MTMATTRKLTPYYENMRRGKEALEERARREGWPYPYEVRGYASSDGGKNRLRYSIIDPRYPGGPIAHGYVTFAGDVRYGEPEIVSVRIVNTV